MRLRGPHRFIAFLLQLALIVLFGGSVHAHPLIEGASSHARTQGAVVSSPVSSDGSGHHRATLEGSEGETDEGEVDGDEAKCRPPAHAWWVPASRLVALLPPPRGPPAAPSTLRYSSSAPRGPPNA